MGKHCKHPARKVLARRRRLVFLAHDLLRVTIVVGLSVVVVFLVTILLEGRV